MGCQSSREVKLPFPCVAMSPSDPACYRLRTANILLISMKALANEIAKNLVLAGIGSMTIQDDQLVHEDDLGSQFFISEQHVGQNVRLPTVRLDFQSDFYVARRSSSATDTKAQPKGLLARRHPAGQATASRVLSTLRYDCCDGP